MKCLPLFCAALALTLTVAPGCKKQDGDNAAAPKARGGPDEVVASVDGVKYLRKDLDELVGIRMGLGDIPENQLEEARNQLEKRFINEFIQKTLLLNEAQKEGIVVTDEERKEMFDRVSAKLAEQNMTLDQYLQTSPLGEERTRAEFEKGLLFEKLIKDKVVSKIVIEEDVIAKALEELTQANAKADEARKTKLAKIEQLKKDLDGGADFAELAKEHSGCPSGKRAGGDLGTFQRGMMVKPFDDAAFAQEVGKVGDIVETQFGYHLVKVTEKTPAAAATGDTPETPETVAASHILVSFGPEDQVHPLLTVEELREELTGQRAQVAAQEYLGTLRAKAKIESILPEELDPLGM